MPPAAAITPEAYIAALPPDRRAAISAVRGVIRANLDRDFAESIQWGMICYAVPHSVFPAGYHCDPDKPLPYAALASQKNYMAVYLMGPYSDPALDRWFRDAWVKTGRKLDMGKSCLRFKKLEDVALDVLAEAIRRVPAKDYVERYLATLAARDMRAGAGKSTKAAEKPARAKVAKTATKKKAATEPARGKPASRARSVSRR